MSGRLPVSKQLCASQSVWKVAGPICLIGPRLNLIVNMKAPMFFLRCRRAGGSLWGPRTVTSIRECSSQQGAQRPPLERPLRFEEYFEVEARLRVRRVETASALRSGAIESARARAGGEPGLSSARGGDPGRVPSGAIAVLAWSRCGATRGMAGGGGGA